MKGRFESADPLRRSGGRRLPPGALARARASGSAGGSDAVPRHEGSLPASSPAPTAGGTAAAPGAGAVPGPSEPTPEHSAPYNEFPLRCYTVDDVRDARYHLMKFQSRQRVDPASQFTPPIRLQRKDPKNLQLVVESVDGETDSINDEEDRPKKGNPFFRRKKTHQAQGGDAAAEAERKLRYEEHYPWVLEDFDSKNAWSSHYEAAQSDAYVVFVFDRDGFKMIPIEKYYRMTARNKFATLSSEQVEERMSKKGNVSRWVMDRLQTQAPSPVPTSQRRLRTVEGSEERGPRKEYEDADYEEEFADDEEAPILDGPEEDIKEVEQKIKQEQRQVGGFNDADDVDALFEDAATTGEVDKNGRKLRKYLRSLEKNSYYDSDENENPYVTDSGSSSEPEVKPDPDGPAAAPLDGSRNGNGGSTPLVLPFRKKPIKNLPPGMVVLQLPPRILERFPRGEWAPGAKRKLPGPVAGSTSSKQKSPGLAVSASGPSAQCSTESSSMYSSARSADSRLLTLEEVRAVIPSRGLTINELIGSLKQKLKQHGDNKDRLRAILKEVSQLREGRLFLAVSS